LFGDLEPSLREEIVDAFEDIRVLSGQNIIKQGDPADNFYVILQGREAPVLVTRKSPGDFFGELALMYDSLRNATVKATTNALVWAVDRTTFKSIMSRHLAGSPVAQVPFCNDCLNRWKIHCLDYLFGSEIDLLSHSMGVRKLHSGEMLYRAGDPGDRLYIVSKGTVIETVHTPTPDGSKQKGDQILLSKGSYFGENALLDDEPRPSTMVAGTMDANRPGLLSLCSEHFLKRHDIYRRSRAFLPGQGSAGGKLWTAPGAH
ncbi:hypothetical protein SELMODRAFT_98922, partial [Selaginella moellendorffii]